MIDLMRVGNVGRALIVAALAMIGAPVFAQQGQSACASTLTRPDSRYTVQADTSQVLDTVTALIWQRCSVGQTWSSASSTCTGTSTGYSWQNAVNFAATQGPAWRLPTQAELYSLVETACSDPAINRTMFPATPSPNQYWSSEPSAASGNALCVNFSSWQVNGGFPQDCWGGNAFPIRLVRGKIYSPSAPTPKITVNSSSPVYVGQPITVDGSGSVDTDGVLAFLSWDFGDGNQAANQTSASHAYSTPGTYTVTLTASDTLGAQASATTKIVVKQLTRGWKYRVSGLAAQQRVVIGLSLDDGAQTLAPTVTTDGDSTTYTVDVGSAYAVTVRTQPQTQICTPDRANGKVDAPADASTAPVLVTVQCVNTYQVSGFVTGLAVDQTVTVSDASGGIQRVTGQNNGPNQPGSFVFTLPNRLATGGSYNVTVTEDIAGLTCSPDASTAQGTVGGQDITGVRINCTNDAGFDLSGLIAGQTVSIDVGGGGLTRTTVSADANGRRTLGTINDPRNFRFYSIGPSSPGGQLCKASDERKPFRDLTCNVTIAYSIVGLRAGESFDLVAFDGSTEKDAARQRSTAGSLSVPGNGTYRVVLDRTPRFQTCVLSAGGATSTINTANGNKPEVSVTASALSNPLTVTCTDIP